MRTVTKELLIALSACIEDAPVSCQRKLKQAFIAFEAETPKIKGSLLQNLLDAIEEGISIGYDMPNEMSNDVFGPYVEEFK